MTFVVKDPGQGYLKITLLDTDKGATWSDALASDNVAWLAITPVRKARILRIGPSNEILDAYFSAAGSKERAIITTIDGTDLTENNEVYKQAVQTEAFDLVIIDRVAPATTELMPQANTFFIGRKSLLNTLMLPYCIRASPSVSPTAASGGWLNTALGIEL